MNLTRLATIMATVGAVTLAGCGTDEDPDTASSTGAASAELGDVDRYCELVAEVNGLGERVFADMAEDAPAEDVMAGWRTLLDEGAAQLEEMTDVAPAEIRDDLPVFLDDLRARAENGESVDAPKAEAAERRMRAFEEENCPGGADGS